MEDFWSKILSGLKSERNEIPKYIKNILELNGLDSMDTLSQIDDTVILELEVFVQTTMSSIIGEINDSRDFYHIFGKCPDKFKFVLGHKILLKNMGAFAKKYIEDINKTDPRKNIRSGKENRVQTDKSNIPQARPQEDSNLNTLTDSLYTIVKRKLSKLRDEDMLRIKDLASTSSAVEPISVYATVSILVFVNLI